MHPISIRVHNNELTMKEISATPRLSIPTINVLDRMNVAVPNSLKHLTVKIFLFENAVQTLQEAQNNEYRDRLLGLMLTTLTVALLVGACLGLVAVGLYLDVSLLLIFGLNWFIGSIYNSLFSQNDEEISRNIILTGAFIPWLATRDKVEKLTQATDEARLRLQRDYKLIADFYANDANRVVITSLLDEMRRERANDAEMQPKEAAAGGRRLEVLLVRLHRNAVIGNLQEVVGYFAALTNHQL